MGTTWLCSVKPCETLSRTMVLRWVWNGSAIRCNRVVIGNPNIAPPTEKCLQSPSRRWCGSIGYGHVYVGPLLGMTEPHWLVWFEWKPPTRCATMCECCRLWPKQSLERSIDQCVDLFGMLPCYIYIYICIWRFEWAIAWLGGASNSLWDSFAWPKWQGFELDSEMVRSVAEGFGPWWPCPWNGSGPPGHPLGKLHGQSLGGHAHVGRCWLSLVWACPVKHLHDSARLLQDIDVWNHVLTIVLPTVPGS